MSSNTQLLTCFLLLLSSNRGYPPVPRSRWIMIYAFIHQPSKMLDPQAHKTGRVNSNSTNPVKSKIMAALFHQVLPCVFNTF